METESAMNIIDEYKKWLPATEIIDVSAASELSPL